MNLTAIIPTFNEEANIEAAIGSVSFAREIIVIDSYSTDKTVEIARSLNCKIMQREFDNFSSQKNHAIRKASNEWVLLLDADERISPELKNEILHTLKSEPEYDAYWIYRNNFFMGREIHYSGWQNDKVIRLFRKSTCRYNGLPVHEEIATIGNTGFLKNRLNHFTYKNFDNYLGKLNRYAWLQAAEYDKKVKRITFFHLFIKPGVRLFRHYLLKQGFRDGFAGLVIAWLQSYAVFTRYIKLWLIRHNKK